MSSKQPREVCGLRPDVGAGGILEGSAHGRSRHLHVPLHARACGLRPWTKSPLARASTCAKLGMAAEAHVDKVATLARWLLQPAARYPPNILYRLNGGGLCPHNSIRRPIENDCMSCICAAVSHMKNRTLIHAKERKQKKSQQRSKTQQRLRGTGRWPSPCGLRPDSTVSPAAAAANN